jgi:hypothetical protein
MAQMWHKLEIDGTNMAQAKNQNVGRDRENL